MKNIHTIFWMGIMLAAMPVIASEDSSDEEDLIGEAPDQDAVRERYHDALRAADGSDADDSDEDSVTDGDSDGAAAEYPASSVGGALLRKRSKPPQYVMLWENQEGLSAEEAFNKIIRQLATATSRVRHSRKNVQVMEHNLERMQQKMLDSSLYLQLDPEQKQRLDKYIEASKQAMLDAKEKQKVQADQASDGETDDDDRPKRADAPPVYITLWTHNPKKFDDNNRFRLIKDNLQSAKNSLKRRDTRDEVRLDKARKRLELMQSAMLSSALYVRLDEAQKQQIAFQIQNMNDVIEGVVRGGDDRAAVRPPIIKPKKSVVRAPKPKERRKLGAVPTYLSTWNDYGTLDPRDALKGITRSLQENIRKAKDGKVYIQTLEENLKNMRQIVPHSDLYKKLSSEQRDAIELLMQKSEEKVEQIKKAAQEKVSADAESGDTSKRPRTDFGAAGGGGGGGANVSQYPV